MAGALTCGVVIGVVTGVGGVVSEVVEGVVRGGVGSGVSVGRLKVVVCESDGVEAVGCVKVKVTVWCGV